MLLDKCCDAAGEELQVVDSGDYPGGYRWVQMTNRDGDDFVAVGAARGRVMEFDLYRDPEACSFIRRRDGIHARQGELVASGLWVASELAAAI